MERDFAALLDTFGEEPAVTQDEAQSAELLRIVIGRLCELDAVQPSGLSDWSRRLRWWFEERRLLSRFAKRQAYELLSESETSIWDEGETLRGRAVTLLRVFVVTAIFLVPSLLILFKGSSLATTALAASGYVYAALGAMAIPLLLPSLWGRWARSRHAKLFSRLEAPVEGRSLHRRLFGATLNVCTRGSDQSVAELRVRLRWGVLARRHSVEISGASRSDVSFYVGSGAELADRDVSTLAPNVKILIEELERQVRGAVHAASHQGRLRLSVTGKAGAAPVYHATCAAWPRLWKLVAPTPARPMAGYREAPDLVHEAPPALLHRIYRTEVLASGAGASEGWWSAARREARWRAEDRLLAERGAPSMTRERKVGNSR